MLTLCRLTLTWFHLSPLTLYLAPDNLLPYNSVQQLNASSMPGRPPLVREAIPGVQTVNGAAQPKGHTLNGNSKEIIISKSRTVSEAFGHADR
jgi:hypothetical protein